MKPSLSLTAACVRCDYRHTDPIRVGLQFARQHADDNRTRERVERHSFRMVVSCDCGWRGGAVPHLRAGRRLARLAPVLPADPRPTQHPGR